MKKFVLKLDLQDDKEKMKALKTVSTLSGIDSISMDMKDKKLTVIGTVDPVSLVIKLRKFWPTDIILVGSAIEPKKEEEKKEGEELKTEEPKKEDEHAIGIRPYRPYYHVHHSMEENPNACVIC